MRFREYALATLVGIVPSVANLCLLGAAARDVSVVASGGTVNATWLSLSVRAFCMVSMLLVSIYSGNKAREAVAAFRNYGKDGRE